MDSRNDKFRDFLGVTAWHEAGYTGTRGMSATGEDFEEKPNAHPGWTAKAFREIAPGRELVYVSLSGTAPDNWERACGEIMDKGIDSMFMSFLISVQSDKKGPITKALETVTDRCSWFNSIGNDSTEKYSTLTRLDYVHGVGAIGIDSDGSVTPEGYSSVSEYVDFCAPANLYIDTFLFEGTSCSAPVLCGMAALVNDFFIDHTGAPLTNEAMYRFLKDNSIDMMTPGHDTKTGWGYVVLPKPEDIEISKYAEVRQMEAVKGKTSAGLCEYARAQLGKPYWYGTFGQTATAELYAAKKAVYPSYYAATDFTSQYGKRVHDCAGLIKGYLMCAGIGSAPVYDVSLDKSADGFYGIAVEKGAISTMPGTPGILVHMKDHIGVYMGNGKVIEARGHAYGVVETPLNGRGWQRWSKCPFIEYTEDEDMFKDTQGHWAEKYIEKCVDAGLMNGRSEEYFEPDGTLTRAEAAAVFARLLDKLGK